MLDPATYINLRNIAVIFANIMLFKYYLFLVLAPFYPVMEINRQIRIAKERLKNHTPAYNPLVTVIIPAWNEEVGVIKTISSVVTNTYDNVEIMVVNDGSTDSTALKVDTYIAENCDTKGFLKSSGNERKHIIFIDKKKNAGKGEALNSGIERAKGEIILTVDADSVLTRSAIANLVKYYADPKLDGVVGNVKVGNANTILGLTQKLEYLFGFYFKRSHAIMGAEYIFGGACASFRAEVFKNIGLYDTTNKTEDIEMTMRFRAAGYKCTYAEDVICYTEGASTVLGLVNQRLRWKKGRMDTFLKYRNLFFSFNRTHNKSLTLFILPVAVFSEIQLFLEPIFISLLLGYSFISLDFISLSFGVLFSFVLYFVNAFFGGRKINWGLIAVFPGTWLFFYFLMWIEFLSLLRSLKLLIRGQSVEWQKWQRVGI